MAKKIDITEEDYAMLMPTGDRILVKRDKGEEKTESGIFYVKEAKPPDWCGCCSR